MYFYRRNTTILILPLQCCHGGEPPKTGTLTHLSEQLEFCQRSLTQYLDEKRKLFPRFYYVSDAVLLAILSSHNDVEEVSKHFRLVRADSWVIFIVC